MRTKLQHPINRYIRKIVRDANLKQVKYCGMKLCPNRYQYITRPDVLEKIFSNTNQMYPKLRTKYSLADFEDVLIPMTCAYCNTPGTLRYDEQICTNCRGSKISGGCQN